MHYIIISIVITLTIIYSILTNIEAMNFYNKNNKINNKLYKFNILCL